jgi:hypothetical protein
MSDLLETLAPEFVFLVQSMGFTVIDEREDPQCFGNAYVVLHSRVFDLMITRDRSQRFVYIRNKNDERKLSIDLRQVGTLICTVVDVAA